MVVAIAKQAVGPIETLSSSAFLADSALQSTVPLGPIETLDLIYQLLLKVVAKYGPAGTD